MAGSGISAHRLRRFSTGKNYGEIGQNARRVAVEKYNRDKLANQALEVISKVARQDYTQDEHD